MLDTNQTVVRKAIFLGPGAYLAFPRLSYICDNWRFAKLIHIPATCGIFQLFGRVKANRLALII